MPHGRLARFRSKAPSPSVAETAAPCAQRRPDVVGAWPPRQRPCRMDFGEAQMLVAASEHVTHSPEAERAGDNALKSGTLHQRRRFIEHSRVSAGVE